MRCVILKHIPNDHWIPWQLHAQQPWNDPVCKEPTTYLAGFKTKVSAENYAKSEKWKIVVDNAA